MKRTEGCGVAHELEAVAATQYEPYADRRLYIVEGQPGIFRRMAMPKSGGDWPAGSVRVLLAGRLACLVRDGRVEDELRAAGLDYLGRPEKPDAEPADGPDAANPPDTALEDDGIF